MKESQKDFECLSLMMINIVKKLSDEQYEKLISGEAQLKYIEPQVSNETIYTQVWGELKTQGSYEEKRKLLSNKKYNLSTKKQLFEFAKFHKIEANTKYSKDEMIECIIMTAEGVPFKVSNDSVISLAKALEATPTVEDAWQLFKTSNLKQTKANLQKLAAELDVFLDKKLKVAEMAEKIIKSVVQSKIDSEIIRKSN